MTEEQIMLVRPFACRNPIPDRVQDRIRRSMERLPETVRPIFDKPKPKPTGKTRRAVGDETFTRIKADMIRMRRDGSTWKDIGIAVGLARNTVSRYHARAVRGGAGMSEIDRIRHLWASVLAIGIEDQRRLVQAARRGERKILGIDRKPTVVRSPEAEIRAARKWLTTDGATIADYAGLTMNVDRAMRHITTSAGARRSVIREGN